METPSWGLDVQGLPLRGLAPHAHVQPRRKVRRKAFPWEGSLAVTQPACHLGRNTVILHVLVASILRNRKLCWLCDGSGSRLCRSPVGQRQLWGYFSQSQSRGSFLTRGTRFLQSSRVSDSGPVGRLVGQGSTTVIRTVVWRNSVV